MRSTSTRSLKRASHSARTRARSRAPAFATEAAAGSWGFSYTDKIAGQCSRIFHATEDPEIRATLAVAVAQIGVGHNRWYVSEVAQALIQAKKTAAERMALVARLEGMEEWARHQIGSALPATKLDPALLPLLKPDAEGEG